VQLQDVLFLLNKLHKLPKNGIGGKPRSRLSLSTALELGGTFYCLVISMPGKIMLLQWHNDNKNNQLLGTQLCAALWALLRHTIAALECCWAKPCGCTGVRTI